MNEDLVSRLAGQVFWMAVGLGLLLLLAEGRWPLSRHRTALGRRWLANVFALAATVAVVQWLPAVTVLGAALLARHNDWGLLNWLSVPDAVGIPLSVLALDASGYLVHRLEHRIPLLWRIHRLHHSDPDVDVTTTYRFHPFDVLLHAGAQVVVAVTVGVPAVAAMSYVILSTLTSVFAHSNLRLPRVADRAIGMIVITPGIHLTHHSVDRDDSNFNFSVCLSCWDRLFGTFRAVPRLGFDGITFGVEGRNTSDATSILKMLADPFLRERIARPMGLLTPRLPVQAQDP